MNRIGRCDIPSNIPITIGGSNLPVSVTDNVIPGWALDPVGSETNPYVPDVELCVGPGCSLWSRLLRSLSLPFTGIYRQMLTQYWILKTHGFAALRQYQIATSPDFALAYNSALIASSAALIPLGGAGLGAAKVLASGTRAAISDAVLVSRWYGQLAVQSNQWRALLQVAGLSSASASPVYHRLLPRLNQVIAASNRLTEATPAITDFTMGLLDPGPTPATISGAAGAATRKGWDWYSENY